MTRIKSGRDGTSGAIRIRLRASKCQQLCNGIFHKIAPDPFCSLRPPISGDMCEPLDALAAAIAAGVIRADFILIEKSMIRSPLVRA